MFAIASNVVGDDDDNDVVVIGLQNDCTGFLDKDGCLVRPLCCVVAESCFVPDDDDEDNEVVGVYLSHTFKLNRVEIFCVFSSFQFNFVFFIIFLRSTRVLQVVGTVCKVIVSNTCLQMVDVDSDDDDYDYDDGVIGGYCFV